MDALRSQPWPGNVRDLRNLVERLLLTSGGEVVTIEELPSQPAASPDSLDAAERDAVLRAIGHEHGNLAGAARRLGVSRGTIYRKMCRYGLT